MWTHFGFFSLCVCVLVFWITRVVATCLKHPFNNQILVNLFVLVDKKMSYGNHFIDLVNSKM